MEAVLQECNKSRDCLPDRLTACPSPPSPPNALTPTPQALTLFDEARCRGADLQLRADAVGLLTLGPATCKDKLMQAAGRMRKLGGWELWQSTSWAGGFSNVLQRRQSSASRTMSFFC